MNTINTLIKKIAAGVASASLLASVMAPAAFADNTVVISGNGSGSINQGTITNNCTATVSQSSSLTVNTTQTGNANTGDVKVSGNTNTGDISVLTGDATVTNTSTVTGGGNTATTPTCCDCQGTTTVVLDTNGTGSLNQGSVNNRTHTSARQTLTGNVHTTQTGKAKTGRVRTLNNTGAGTISVDTGAASTTGSSTVTLPSNTLL